MEIKRNPILIETFNFEGRNQPVSFTETMQVADGADCDVYTFDGDSTKDLGIIRMDSGKKTPLQRVLKGDRTVEGYISGKGKLTITTADGKQKIYKVDEETKEPFSVIVEIGELMQWEADKESGLVAYEVCFPPYEDGRYKNLK